MNAENYEADLENAITPELNKRLEKIAVERRQSVADVIIDFLSQGANTPIILGAGAST